MVGGGRCVYVQEELGVAADDGLEEGISILWGFGDGLAEGVGVDAADVSGEEEMVGGDGRWKRANTLAMWKGKIGDFKKKPWRIGR